nr:MAG TPA: ribonuclease E [Inoviridae sp.]
MGVLNMKYSLEILKSIFIDKLQDFKSANAAYLAAEHEFINFDLDHGTSGEFKAVRKKLQIARVDLEYCAVAFCEFLEANIDVLEDVSADAPEVVPVDAPADAPEVVSVDAPADAPEVVPVDAPADAPEVVPVDAPADASEVVPVDAPADAPEDVSEDIIPVMSSKCKLCPSCVDGRCFFVPDIYDSVFPCQSPAWDSFFRGGSRSPAP